MHQSLGLMPRHMYLKSSDHYTPGHINDLESPCRRASGFRRPGTEMEPYSHPVPSLLMDRPCAKQDNVFFHRGRGISPEKDKDVLIWTHLNYDSLCRIFIIQQSTAITQNAKFEIKEHTLFHS